MKTKFLFSSLLLLVGFAVFFAVRYGHESSRPADFTILMTPEEFVPSELTIKKGQSVQWSNEDTDYRWPASDLHPIHEIYPEFDPREPLAPGESWVFTFQRAGSWRYHDHLRPGERGVVIVTEE